MAIYPFFLSDFLINFFLVLTLYLNVFSFIPRMGSTVFCNVSSVLRNRNGDGEVKGPTPPSFSLSLGQHVGTWYSVIYNILLVDTELQFLSQILYLLELNCTQYILPIQSHYRRKRIKLQRIETDSG